MRLLQTKHTRFGQVAYLDDHTLLTAGYARGSGYGMYLWDLIATSEPRELPYDYWQTARLLFLPGGPAYLRATGHWPAGQELPPTLPPTAPDLSALIAVHPDGGVVLLAKPLPSGFGIGKRILIREANGEVVVMFDVPGWANMTGAISADGRLAAVSDGTKVVRLWDVVSRRVSGEILLTNAVRLLAFAGARLAVVAGRTVRLWDMATGREAVKWPTFRKFATALAVSPDGRLVAVAGDGMVRLWDAASGVERGQYSWEIGEVKRIAFAPGGLTAAVAGTGGVVVWDIDG